MGIRTPDIQLAKLALYQLSYTPLLPRAPFFPRGVRLRLRKKTELHAAFHLVDRAEYLKISV